MKKLLLISMLLALQAGAQVDTSLFRTQPTDTGTRAAMNLDAVYNRPFLTYGKMPVSIGGYVEANYEHMGTNGSNEGHQFQMRRLTVFFASTISSRVKFLSEIEFEEGTKEISLEFAAVDLELDPLLVLRAGVILNPIGAFNQNHDSPKWEFVDRPLSATRMLPATWSNTGAGIYGKKYSGKWSYAYEAYISNGFNERIINNNTGRTSLAASKNDPERFAESSNGEPLYTGKLSARHRRIGELGVSYMGGIYNKYRDDGFVLDKKRWVHTCAIDFNTVLPKLNTKLIAEFAWVFVDVPETYSAQFGSRQQGGFLDIVQPVLKRRILGYDRAIVNLACRLEYVDWNVATFSTGDRIGDEIWAIVPALSFRPGQQTVIRFNYRFQRQYDLFANPPALTGGWQLGISSYW